MNSKSLNSRPNKVKNKEFVESIKRFTIYTSTQNRPKYLLDNFNIKSKHIHHLL